MMIKVDNDFIEAMKVFREPDRSMGLLEACSKNVVVFSERMLGIKPYSWQVLVMNELQKSIENKDYDKEFIALTSRQIGKSTLVAIVSLWATVFNKYPGTIMNNTSVLLTSATDVQAKKLLYEMKRLLKLGDRFMATTYIDGEGLPMFGKEFFSLLLDDNEPNNTTTITFKPYDANKHGQYLLKGSLSGSTIKSYPPTSSVLGETASVVIVDEAGKTDKIDDQFFYDYLYPVGNSTNALRLYTSTPWVNSGFFYTMVDPDKLNPSDKPIKVFTFTIDAISLENTAYYEKVKDTIKMMEVDGKLDEIQRAYYCRFVQGEKSYFDPQRVMDIFQDNYTMSETFNKPCDVGIDFGGSVISRSCITVSYLDDDGVIRRVYKKTYPVGKDDGLMDDLVDIRKRFNVQRMIPDNCPQGDYLIREMVKRGWDVTPMTFKTDKTKKYSAFRSMLNRGKVRSFNDDDLKVEMLALEIIQGERENKIKHAPGYTDDEIDSFVMSSYFYLTEEGGVKTYDW